MILRLSIGGGASGLEGSISWITGSAMLTGGTREAASFTTGSGASSGSLAMKTNGSVVSITIGGWKATRSSWFPDSASSAGGASGADSTAAGSTGNSTGARASSTGGGVTAATTGAASTGGSAAGGGTDSTDGFAEKDAARSSDALPP